MKVVKKSGGNRAIDVQVTAVAGQGDNRGEY